MKDPVLQPHTTCQELQEENNVLATQVSALQGKITSLQNHLAYLKGIIKGLELGGLIGKGTVDALDN